MLRREHEIRLSAEMQATYEEVEKRWDADWMDATDRMQRRLVKEEFGLEEAVGLTAIRCALQLFPNDAEIREIPLYVRFNRARDGPLLLEGEVPNIPLHAMDGKPCRLLDFAKPGRPLVVLAGSYS
jgi:hypothetical protein